MKHSRIIFLFILVFASYTCEKDKNNDEEFTCFQIDKNDNTQYDIIRKWEFLGVFNKEIYEETCRPPGLGEMNIVFSDTSRFHAVSLCNTFEGSFSTAEPDIISIADVSTTLILCIDDTIRHWEELYLDGLKNASSFRISRNILVIETTSQTSMVFRAD